MTWSKASLKTLKPLQTTSSLAWIKTKDNKLEVIPETVSPTGFLFSASLRSSAVSRKTYVKGLCIRGKGKEGWTWLGPPVGGKTILSPLLISYIREDTVKPRKTHLVHPCLYVREVSVDRFLLCHCYILRLSALSSPCRDSTNRAYKWHNILHLIRIVYR